MAKSQVIRIQDVLQRIKMEHYYDPTNPLSLTQLDQGHSLPVERMHIAAKQYVHNNCFCCKIYSTQLSPACVHYLMKSTVPLRGTCM